MFRSEEGRIGYTVAKCALVCWQPSIVVPASQRSKIIVCHIRASAYHRQPTCTIVAAVHQALQQCPEHVTYCAESAARRSSTTTERPSSMVEFSQSHAWITNTAMGCACTHILIQCIKARRALRLGLWIPTDSDKRCFLTHQATSRPGLCGVSQRHARDVAHHHLYSIMSSYKAPLRRQLGETEQ